MRGTPANDRRVVSESGIEGTGAFAAAASSLAGSGIYTTDGVGGVTSSPAVFAGVGDVPAIAVGNFAAPAPVLAGVGEQTISAAGTFDPGAAALAGIGVMSIEGTGEYFARLVTLAGIGQFGSAFRAAPASFGGLGAGGAVLDDISISGPISRWRTKQVESHWRTSLQTTGR